MASRIGRPRPAPGVKLVEYQCIARLRIDLGYSMTAGLGPQIDQAIAGLEYSHADTDVDGAMLKTTRRLIARPDWPPEVVEAVRTIVAHCEQRAVADGLMDAASAAIDL